MKKTLIMLGLITSTLYLGITACSKSSSSSCSENCSLPIGSGEFATPVASGAHGDFTLVYEAITAGGPFVDGDEIKVNIKAEELTVTFGDKCVTLDNPMNRYGPTVTEATFRDNCVFNAEFAVSEKSGTLNEVNVGTLGGGFLGQFTVK